MINILMMGEYLDPTQSCLIKYVNDLANIH